MKLNEDLYAVVRPDGTVATECGCPIISESRKPMSYLAETVKLQTLNGPGLRVAKVRLVEVEENG